MNFLKRFFLSAVAVSSVTAVVSAQATGFSGLSGLHSTTSLYTQYIAKSLHKVAVPGAIVGIWQVGRPPYLRAFGSADVAEKTPMTTRMVMPVGQISSALTVRAILELARAGKIQLQDTVSQYLQGVPEGKVITVADLALMRSGLPDYLTDPAFIQESKTHPEARLSPEQLLHYSFARPLLFKPGSRFAYSATNSILLGLIIEKVTGKPLSRVITEQILQPHKLRNTHFSTSFADPLLEARGYTVTDSTKLAALPWNPSQFWAAGAVTATASDMQRWAKINADLQPYAQILGPYQFHSADEKNTRVHYRWGSLDNNGWIGSASRQAGYESVVIYAPKSKDTIVIFLNSDATDQGVSVAARLAQHLSRFISPHAIFLADARPQ
ncbi:serine hydrolase domain-containing protein [Acidithiobacillus sp. M4-SHS-6]|uniref:serine hydrolase domain-containing protein n=1 Tax=Acidithiobacillus sp. M4-SHS-6 TaxID=3383024 RepID=UPI0039BDFA58